MSPPTTTTAAVAPTIHGTGLSSYDTRTLSARMPACLGTFNLSSSSSRVSSSSARLAAAAVLTSAPPKSDVVMSCSLSDATDDVQVFLEAVNGFGRHGRHPSLQFHVADPTDDPRDDQQQKRHQEGCEPARHHQ